MAPKVWVTAHSREEGPAAFVGNQQVKAKAGLTHCSTPQGLETVLEDGGGGGDQKPLGSRALVCP